MKKLLLLSFLVFLGSFTIAQAKFYNENNIGKCTSRNALGYCVDSATHYCYKIGKNGRCEMWFLRSKTTEQNLAEFYSGETAEDAINQYKNQMNAIDKALGIQAQTINVKPVPVYPSINNNSVSEADKVQAYRNEEEKKFNETKTKTIPNTERIKNEIKNLNGNIVALQKKKDVGLDVDDEININSYKEEKLRALEDLTYDFEKIYYAKKDGDINDSEYNQLISNIKKKDDALKISYDEIMNTPSEKIKKEMKHNKSIMGVTLIKNQSNSKVDKFNNGVNNGVNILNNTMNGVNSVRGMFGL